MKEYKHILLAVELEGGCDKLPAHRALSLAKEFEAQLTVVHAVEHMTSYGAAYGIAAGADIEEILLDNAKEAMTRLGAELQIPESRQLIKMGPAKLVILEEAKEIGADLIIVGSHGRHGVRLLLGSTANAVLHGALVDVLAVRIPDEK
jgi:universal stress protein A